MANWSKAFAGAASGLDSMSKVKLQEADYLYKDMAQQNRQRFAAQESQKQRDFLGAEKQEQREWEAPFKKRGLDIQERQTELSGELKILSQQSLDAQRRIENALRERQTAASEARNEVVRAAEEQKEIRLTAEQRMKELDSELKRLEAAREPLMKQKQSPLFSTLPNKQEIEDKLAQYDEDERMYKQQYEWDKEVIQLGKVREDHYNYASDSLTGDPAIVHDLSMKYAKLNDKQRAEIVPMAQQLMKQHPQQLKNMQQAVGAAIDSLSGKGFESSQAAPEVEAPPVEAPQMTEAPPPESEFVPKSNRPVGYGTPHPSTPVNKEEEQLEKAAREIAQRKGWLVDDSVPGWMGGGIPPKHREEAYALARKEIGSKVAAATQ